MRRITILIVAVSLFSSCKQKDRVPSNILPQKEMQSVLWDIMRADQYVADYVVTRNPAMNRDAMSLKYYQKIFTIHKITREKFQESLQYYKARPALFQAIVDSIAVMPTDSTRKKLPFDTTRKIPIMDSFQQKKALRDSTKARLIRKTMQSAPKSEIQK